MQILENVISDEHLKHANKEINALISERAWGTNLTWGPDLYDGITGTSLSAYVSDKFTEQIVSSLSNFLPEHQSLNIHYNLWLHNSGINFHDDNHVKFGATLYLNEVWNKRWGGLFIWEDKNKELNVVCPKAKMLILNDNMESHSVTPVLTNCSYHYRRTIQIWGI